MLNKTIVGKFLIIVIALYCLALHLNAQNEMSTNQPLTAKQQGIISIAAYIAKGELTHAPQDRPLSGYGAFAPVIDTFLKEHLFADIFERDVLTYAQRELVTISVLSAIGGAEPMLRSHLAICLNVGLTPK